MNNNETTPLRELQEENAALKKLLEENKKSFREKLRRMRKANEILQSQSLPAEQPEKDELKSEIDRLFERLLPSDEFGEDEDAERLYEIVTNLLLSQQPLQPGKTLEEWISVEERLPEMSNFRPPIAGKPLPKEFPIIVATNEGRVFETIYTGLGFANVRSNTDYVTHWQPLPTPPQK